ncbi:hypothetical protein RN001_004427 [Aquatica leii]|uniref:Uncharacterized protein n=1 Tax=Aquatica leii TaxID=1421715 RepID=A0AAN7PBL7_9COLE|nr:hypothetical protein RN001_004427 [Aquatica leii]
MTYATVNWTIKREHENVPQVIISTVVQDIASAASGRLPNLSTIKRTIRRVRVRISNTTTLPTSISDIELPEEYKKTEKGNNFLEFDWGNDDDRFLIFGTELNLQLLTNSRHWFMDGTFRTVPSLFYQLYSVHGFQDRLSVPLIYVLLPNKSIQQNGLKERYDTDPEFSLRMRYLSALAFVPVAHVTEALNQLTDSDIFPEESQNVIDYFEDT